MLLGWKDFAGVSSTEPALAVPNRLVYQGNAAEATFPYGLGLMPATFLIWTLGLLGLGWYGWRKRRAA
ncbi:MAG: hypothetical protein H8E44_02865 [Planctomycetes bacterium]|nr:hypothetical protein [Planctomycetota bacterium]